MKELTIEQKAKAYDEAAERALKLKVQNPFDTVGQMMEYIFPELAESDDEKIRKEILDYIDKATGCKRWVAWLEKQGEQKPADKVEPKFKVGDKIRRKAPSSCDKDMQVARIKEDYYSQRYKLYMWGLPLYKP